LRFPEPAGCSFRTKRDRSINAKKQKLAYIANSRMKRQPTTSASDKPDSKRYSQSKSDCDIDEMLRADLAVCSTQRRSNERPRATRNKPRQPVERRTAPAPCAVTWVRYDTRVRRSCCVVPKTCLFTPSSQRGVAGSLVAHVSSTAVGDRHGGRASERPWRELSKGWLSGERTKWNCG